MNGGQNLIGMCMCYAAFLSLSNSWILCTPSSRVIE
jgi:hypothetical protein